jgi:hypothetical protein
LEALLCKFAAFVPDDKVAPKKSSQLRCTYPVTE